MSADNLLSRLDGVKSTGRDRWIARCPAHADKHPSLSVRETEAGVILAHCFSGCEVAEIVSAVGLKLEDLFPPRPAADHVPGVRRPFLPSDVFDIARLEIGVAAIIAADMHKRKEVSEADYERLFVVVERLNDIGAAAYGR